MNTNNISHQEMVQVLMKALYHDDFKQVEDLLNQGVNVNLPYNHAKWTPFMWVCKEHCDPAVIELFLKHGGNVNSRNNEGSTPLHIMARHRSSFDCLELLIMRGASQNAQDNDGWTPLMDAVHHPQVAMRISLVFSLLLGTDCRIKNKDGKTAYDIAKENPDFTDKEVLGILEELAHEK